MKLKVLDLFSGIGGFSLGLERTGGFETVAFCEINPFCQKVLKKHWPDVPIYNDVRNLDYDGAVDVITGGFPCQPFSTAGKRQGKDDDRHLWPAMLQLIQKYRPTWVIGENVNGLISMGLDTVLSDLGYSNYGARTFVIPAVSVNARHRRDRLWIVANSKSTGKRGEIGNVCEEDGGSWGSLFQQPDSTSKNVANTMCQQNQRINERRFQHQSTGSSKALCHATSKGFPDWAGGTVGQPRPITEFERPDGREIECDFRGIPHGVSRRVDRLKSLGNAVVPQIPEIIGRAILAAEGLSP